MQKTIWASLTRCSQIRQTVAKHTVHLLQSIYSTKLISWKIYLGELQVCWGFLLLAFFVCLFCFVMSLCLGLFGVSTEFS